MQVPISVIWGAIGAFGVLAGFGISALTIATKYGRENGTITTTLRHICEQVASIALSIEKIDKEVRSNLMVMAQVTQRVERLEADVSELKRGITR